MKTQRTDRSRELKPFRQTMKSCQNKGSFLPTLISAGRKGFPPGKSQGLFTGEFYNLYQGSRVGEGRVRVTFLLLFSKTSSARDSQSAKVPYFGAVCPTLPQKVVKEERKPQKGLGQNRSTWLL